MEEVWKDIEGFEGKYQVSNKGNIASLNFNNTGKFGLLKPKLNRCGLYEIKLSKNNKTKNFLVSTLVGKAFLNQKTPDMKIMHIGEKTYDGAENLRWAYQSEIFRQMYKKGNRKIGKPTRYKIGYKKKGYMNLSQLARGNGLEPKLLDQRLRRGWTLKEALDIPKERQERILNIKLYKYKDKLMSMKQLAKLSGINEKAIQKRLKRGWDIESAVEIPLAKNNNKKE